ncbi:D-amino-acid transaminase [Ancylobacter defluvii]|uniref:Probable branched-chain-amino-acid aminotransferase n=1 Tax=Ancylobacter defluvii TaxID=1282440 RepID=A0A9W6JUQ0_9HYPH|nr:D-amino-acid transaminase [Ancylobacter defluvii]MBS7585734.1 D-amino-acid transaminase [Ancylobacter defluvii]GLK84106.1 D-amino-acid transaminase [Ancylobacter defluvii]
MSRVAYVNGLYVPHAEAAVHVEDRGYQFADGVYEVCEVRGGRMIDERRHMGRLQRSLRELRIVMPMSLGALGVVLRETIRRNRVRDGIVYLQVTRGVARRDHYFPAPDTPPSIVVTARASIPAKVPAPAISGAAVITVPDNRWDRVDIKTVGLLPNVLAKQAAKEAGAREAWFVRDGVVMEGGSTNAWIVTQAGAIVTRPAESGILRGITRTVLLEVANRLGLTVDERDFTLDEAFAAREAFISSASNVVVPIVSIDGKTIGDGKPGPVARSLRDSFYDVAEFARK